VFDIFVFFYFPLPQIFFYFPPLVLFCCVVHVMKCRCASLKSPHLAITYLSCSLTTQVRGLFVIFLNCALLLLFMWCCFVAQVHRGVLLMTFCHALLSSHFFPPSFVLLCICTMVFFW
jgi:hypothetical protein